MVKCSAKSVFRITEVAAGKDLNLAKDFHFTSVFEEVKGLILRKRATEQHREMIRTAHCIHFLTSKDGHVKAITYNVFHMFRTPMLCSALEPTFSLSFTS